MTKSKIVIKVMHNGCFRGYLKSVSYKNGTFITTQDVSKAKTIPRNRVESEIDFLTGIGFSDGFVFGYDFL